MLLRLPRWRIGSPCMLDQTMVCIRSILQQPSKSWPGLVNRGLYELEIPISIVDTVNDFEPTNTVVQGWLTRSRLGTTKPEEADEKVLARCMRSRWKFAVPHLGSVDSSAGSARNTFWGKLFWD